MAFEYGGPEPCSLDDLRETAFQADAYVNDAKNPKDASSRADEVIPILNDLADSLYMGREVSIHGIYKAVKPIRNEEGQLSSRPYIEKGLVTATAAGFRVIDLDVFFKDVLATERQQYVDLYNELRERSLGQFSVTHALLKKSMPIVSGDGLYESYHHYGLAAPVAASNLFVDFDTAYIPEGEREAFEYEESRRVMDSAGPNVLAFMKALEDRLLEDDDPLQSLATIARDFRLISRNVSPALKIAMGRRLKEIIRDKISGSVYRFEQGMPLSLLKSGESNGAIPCVFEPNDSYVIYIRELARALHYDDVDKPNDIVFNQDEGLFVMGSFIANGYVLDDTFFIPLEHLPKYSYSQVDL